MQITFIVEAKSQSSSRSFLVARKGEAVLFDNVKAMRSVKAVEIVLTRNVQNCAGFIFPRMFFWIPFPQRTG